MNKYSVEVFAEDRESFIKALKHIAKELDAGCVILDPDQPGLCWGHDGFVIKKPYAFTVGVEPEKDWINHD